jgi:hypothetical protein
MLTNIAEIKQFIEWCKANKVKSFANGNISFELSELSFVPGLSESEMSEKLTTAYDETLIDTAQQELDSEEDELLMWSTQK